MTTILKRPKLKKPGKREWQCPHCRIINQEPSTSCAACQEGNPRLTRLQQQLAVALEPDDDATALWESLRRKGVTDSELLAEIAEMLRCSNATSCGAGDSWIAWDVSQAGRLRIWPNERTPPCATDAENAPPLDEAVLIEAVRGIWWIPQPEGETGRGGDKEKNGAAAKAAKKKTHGPSGIAPAYSANHQVIPVARIVSTKNPREHFDQESLERLAQTIREHGILEPLIVRPAAADGTHELLAGERRLRAAKLAGLAEVPAIVRECDEASAARIRLIENFIREDLNAIEEAKAFRAILDAGVTQQQLAQELQLTQPQISSRVRLLELPETWQQRIISGEMPASAGRVLAPWAGRPQVLTAVEESIAKFKQWRPDDEPTVEHYEEWVEDAVYELTETMEAGSWNSPQFKPTDEQLAALDVVELRDGKKTVRVAFNRKLWNELNQAAVNKKAERDAARRSKRVEKEGETAKAAAANPGLSREEKRRKAEQQKRQLQKRIAAWRTRWYQKQLAERLAESKDGQLAVRCALFFAVTGELAGQRSVELGAALADFGGKRHPDRVVAYRRVPATWKALCSVPAGKIEELLRAMLVTWWQHDTEGCHSDVLPHEIEALAGELGVDLKKHWRVDATFLQLFTKDQLADLAKEWGVAAHKAWTTAGDKRADAIDALLLIDNAKRLPPPKCLLNAKV